MRKSGDKLIKTVRGLSQAFLCQLFFLLLWQDVCHFLGVKFSFTSIFFKLHVIDKPRPQFLISARSCQHALAYHTLFSPDFVALWHSARSPKSMLILGRRDSLKWKDLFIECSPGSGRHLFSCGIQAVFWLSYIESLRSCVRGFSAK